MAVFDFFGFASSVLLVTPPGLDQVDLPDIEEILIDVAAINAGDPSTFQKAVDLRPITQRIKVSIGLGQLAQIEVTLAVDYGLALLLTESKLMNYGNLLFVQFGYPGTGQVSAPFMVSTFWPVVRLNEKLSTITLNGLGAFAFGALLESCKTWIPQNYGSLLAFGIVKALAEQCGLTVQYGVTTVSTLVGFGFSPQGFPVELRVPVSSPFPRGLVDPGRWTVPIQQMESDFIFMQRILKSANCGFFLNGATGIQFFDIDDAKASQPVATFRMFAQVNSAADITATGGEELPVISFNTSTNWSFQQGRSIRVDNKTGINPDKTPTVVLPPPSAVAAIQANAQSLAQAQAAVTQEGTRFIDLARSSAVAAGIGNTAQNTKQLVTDALRKASLKAGVATLVHPFLEPAASGAHLGNVSGGAIAAVPTTRFVIQEGLGKRTVFTVARPDLKKAVEDGSATGSIYVSPPRLRDPGAAKIYETLAKEQESALVTATLTTPGNPQLSPGANIQLTGAGLLDKGYWIRSVEHTLDQSGFITSLDLLSNGLKLVSDSVASSGARASNVNAQPAPPTGLGAINAAIQGRRQ